MKICLINPRHEESLDPNLDVPLGILYIATVLKNINYDVTVLDLSFYDRNIWESIIPYADIYGITILTASFHRSMIIRDICKKINPKSKIIAGGAHSSALPEETSKEFDIVCVGDGEGIIQDIIKYIEINNDSNLAFPKIFDGNKKLMDINEIPFPARELVPIEKYTRLVNGEKATSIITSRGCVYRCTFCLPKGTLILTEDLTYIPIEQIKVGDILIGVIKKDHFFNFERSRVLDTFKRKDRIYKIKTMDGDVYSTEEHPWLTDRGRWRPVSWFKPGDKLRKVSTPVKLPKETNDYKIGYIAGAFEGDGCIGEQDIFRDYGIYKSHYARLVGDYDMMDTVLRYSNDLEYGLYEVYFNAGNWALDSSIKTQKKYFVETIEKLLNKDRNTIESDEYKRGYLAGIYDAEGSWPRNSDDNYASGRNALRFHNTNERILNRISEYLHYFGFHAEFDYLERLPGQEHKNSIRILGGLNKILLFFTLVNPKVEDKKQQIFDYHIKSKSGFTQILDISPVDICDVYNLETTTGNFIADGFITHNCQNSMRKEKVRFRTIDNIIREIKELILKYNYKTLIFYDDTLTTRSDFFQLLEEIKKLNIIFRCNGDARKNNKELFQKLYESGCREICFGIESGSQKILDKINKKVTVEQNKLAIYDAKKVGLNVKAFLILGSPGESWDTVKETINFMQETRPQYWTIFQFIPLPGCVIYENPEKYDIKIITKDWKQYYNIAGYNEGGLVCETEYMTIEDIKKAREYMLENLPEQTGPLQDYYKKLNK